MEEEDFRLFNQINLFPFVLLRRLWWVEIDCEWVEKGGKGMRRQRERVILGKVYGEKRIRLRSTYR